MSSSQASSSSTSSMFFPASPSAMVASCVLCVPIAVLRLVVQLLAKLLLPSSSGSGSTSARRPTITRRTAYTLPSPSSSPTSSSSLHRVKPSTKDLSHLISSQTSSSSFNSTCSSASSSNSWNSDASDEDSEDSDILFFSTSSSRSSSRRNSLTSSRRNSSTLSAGSAPLCSSPLSFTYSKPTATPAQLKPMSKAFVQDALVHIEDVDDCHINWHGEDEDDEGLIDLLLVPRAVKKFFVL